MVGVVPVVVLSVRTAADGASPAADAGSLTEVPGTDSHLLPLLSRFDGTGGAGGAQGQHSDRRVTVDALLSRARARLTSAVADVAASPPHAPLSALPLSLSTLRRRLDAAGLAFTASHLRASSGSEAAPAPAQPVSPHHSAAEVVASRMRLRAMLAVPHSADSSAGSPSAPRARPPREDAVTHRAELHARLARLLSKQPPTPAPPRVAPSAGVSPLLHSAALRLRLEAARREWEGAVASPSVVDPAFPLTLTPAAPAAADSAARPTVTRRLEVDMLLPPVPRRIGRTLPTTGVSPQQSSAAFAMRSRVEARLAAAVSEVQLPDVRSVSTRVGEDSEHQTPRMANSLAESMLLPPVTQRRRRAPLAAVRAEPELSGADASTPQTGVAAEVSAPPVAARPSESTAADTAPVARRAVPASPPAATDAAPTSEVLVPPAFLLPLERTASSVIEASDAPAVVHADEISHPFALVGKAGTAVSSALAAPEPPQRAPAGESSCSYDDPQQLVVALTRRLSLHAAAASAAAAFGPSRVTLLIDFSSVENSAATSPGALSSAASVRSVVAPPAPPIVVGSITGTTRAKTTSKHKKASGCFSCLSPATTSAVDESCPEAVTADVSLQPSAPVVAAANEPTQQTVPGDVVAAPSSAAAVSAAAAVEPEHPSAEFAEPDLGAQAVATSAVRVFESYPAILSELAAVDPVPASALAAIAPAVQLAPALAPMLPSGVVIAPSTLHSSFISANAAPGPVEGTILVASVDALVQPSAPAVANAVSRRRSASLAVVADAAQAPLEGIPAPEYMDSPGAVTACGAARDAPSPLFDADAAPPAAPLASVIAAAPRNVAAVALAAPDLAASEPFAVRVAAASPEAAVTPHPAAALAHSVQAERCAPGAVSTAPLRTADVAAAARAVVFSKQMAAAAQASAALEAVAAPVASREAVIAHALAAGEASAPGAAPVMPAEAAVLPSQATTAAPAAVDAPASQSASSAPAERRVHAAVAEAVAAPVGLRTAESSLASTREPTAEARAQADPPAERLAPAARAAVASSEPMAAAAQASAALEAVTAPVALRKAVIAPALAAGESSVPGAAPVAAAARAVLGAPGAQAALPSTLVAAVSPSQTGTAAPAAVDAPASQSASSAPAERRVHAAVAEAVAAPVGLRTAESSLAATREPTAEARAQADPPAERLAPAARGAVAAAPSRRVTGEVITTPVAAEGSAKSVTGPTFMPAGKKASFRPAAADGLPTVGHTPVGAAERPRAAGFPDHSATAREARLPSLTSGVADTAPSERPAASLAAAPLRTSAVASTAWAAAAVSEVNAASTPRPQAAVTLAAAVPDAPEPDTVDASSISSRLTSGWFAVSKLLSLRSAAGPQQAAAQKPAEQPAAGAAPQTLPSVPRALAAAPAPRAKTPSSVPRTAMAARPAAAHAAPRGPPAPIPVPLVAKRIVDIPRPQILQPSAASPSQRPARTTQAVGWHTPSPTHSARKPRTQLPAASPDPALAASASPIFRPHTQDGAGASPACPPLSSTPRSVRRTPRELPSPDADSPDARGPQSRPRSKKIGERDLMFGLFFRH